MNLIPGVKASDEMLVLEQVTYQSALYLPLTDQSTGIKENDTLQNVVNKTVAAIHSGALREYDESTQTWESIEDYEKRISEYQNYIKELVDVIDAHPEIGKATIGHLSWQSDDPNREIFPPNGMVACTFENEKTRQDSICFRGTPSGSWIDNAKGITGVLDADYLEEYEAPDGTILHLSPMQCAALRYTKQIYDENSADHSWMGSGHSKGGNLIQLATMVFPNLFQNTYSLDGQSFPKETLDDLYRIDKDGIGRGKILGINADNDYVNGLGFRLTLPNQTLFLQTPEIGAGFSAKLNHYSIAMLNNGNLANRGTPGPISKTVSRISQDLLSIEDTELREAVAFLIMQKLQESLSGEEPVDGQAGWDIAEDQTKALDPYIEQFTLGLRSLVKLPIPTSTKLALIGGLASTGIGAAAIYLNQDYLINYLVKGEPDENAAEQFLKEHDFETEEEIANYLQEHTENGKMEYLVRGALLRCRHGTHARRLNLLKCHGVYITTHPVVHEANCVAGFGPEKDNIPFFGVCKAPIPPIVERVAYTKDRPRDQNGCPCGESPGGFESGWRCQPEIVGLWKDTYPKTRIVDNGDLDHHDRDLVTSGEELPKGYSAVTTLSFLVCRYGGLIEPYNSGQDYISDAAELAYAQEHNLQDTQDSAMQEVGGEGDPHGESIQETPKILNGKQLSENAGYIIDALAPTSLDGKIVKFDWHNIEQLLASDSKSMNPDKYDALNYVFGQMHTIDDLQKFINLCYTVPIALDSGDSQQDDNVYAVPNEILTNMMDYYACESEKGTLDPSIRCQAEILGAIAECGTRVYIPGESCESPILLERDGFDYSVTIPAEEPGKPAVVKKIVSDKSMIEENG